MWHVGVRTELTCFKISKLDVSFLFLLCYTIFQFTSTCLLFHLGLSFFSTMVSNWLARKNVSQITHFGVKQDAIPQLDQSKTCKRIF